LRSWQEASNNASPLPIITKLAFAAALAFMPASSEYAKHRKETAVVRSQGVQDNEAGLLTRIIFWLTKRRIGRVPLGLRVRARARDPKLFRQIVRMDLYAVSQGAIPVRLLRNQFFRARTRRTIRHNFLANYRARFNRTFAIAAQGFAEGQFCPLPEHVPQA
jgi:hypothetical protein